MEGRLPAAPGRAICFFAILLAALVGVSGAHDGLLSNTKQQPLSSACASLKASGINVHATKKATVGGGNIPDTGGGAACHVEFALHVKPAIAFTGAWDAHTFRDGNTHAPLPTWPQHNTQTVIYLQYYSLIGESLASAQPPAMIARRPFPAQMSGVAPEPFSDHPIGAQDETLKNTTGF